MVHHVDGAGGSLVLLLLSFPLYEFRNIMQLELYTLVLTIITVFKYWWVIAQVVTSKDVVQSLRCEIGGCCICCSLLATCCDVAMSRVAMSCWDLCLLLIGLVSHPSRTRVRGADYQLHF